MKTFFSNKRRILLIGGAINLLILSIMAVAIVKPSLGTYAKKKPQALTETNQGAFGEFCYTFLLQGNFPQGVSCLEQANKVTKLLQQVMSPDSFAKWPRQLSMSDLAMQNLLVNPQNQKSIKTKEDFVGAISPESGYTDLLILFEGEQGGQLLSTLWAYRPTNNVTPAPAAPSNPTPNPTSTDSNCKATATNNNGTPGVNASTPTSTATCVNQPPSCPVNPQSFKFSDLWPTVGPKLLEATGKALQYQDGSNVGTYDIYGRLLLKDRCSVATLAQTMKLNGQSVTQPDQVYRWERETLINTLIDTLIKTGIGNFPSVQLRDLIWVVVQPGEQLDLWFSGALITNPISPTAQPTSPTVQPTSPTVQPTNPAA